ncbi:TolC family protein [Noviherbaspirillum suwonense]|jgi:cobalt-zinc-cadmium efflux system outer membrane protein|uniref:Outer membrane protein TolC n=1 Tax=Noviherbaspirillum suwonense TaxID=1224511 RepID=A0ABY1QEX8_9BURK|nr:TolC family protein [Noviherbaspirillum suwonense]SMP67640.1 Outer membrane protein TolC [Noviherbaspirillum suwonense]
MTSPSRLLLILLALLAALSGNAAAATAYASEHAAASEPLSVLPPEPVARQALASLPQLRSSTFNIDLAASSRTRLQAGPHEWSVRAGLGRRTDETGKRFNEQELVIERPVRWFGKADKDAAIGDKGTVIAQAAYEDAWHEAGRSLMKEWFDALREIAATARLAEQQDITQRLRGIAEKRVRAGDAAELELLQADTESQRVAALVQQSRLRADQALQLLASTYPGLPQPQAGALPAPPAPRETADFWFDKITGDNHELTLARAEADLYQLQASRSASDRMPDPTVGVRASRERGGRENIYGVIIAFPLPGAARTADADSAALRAAMASERLAQAQVRVALAARRLVTETSRSHEIWLTMQRIAEQSQRQAATMMKAYQLGEATLPEALLTRRQAQDAALLAESAQVDALAAHARLLLDAHLLWSVD